MPGVITGLFLQTFPFKGSGHLDFMPWTCMIMTSNLGHKLLLIALGLFIAYGMLVLTSILPLALLDTAWQLRFSAAVVDNAALPLVGVAILHVASHLDQNSRTLRKWHQLVSQWIMIPALGFLLLVPLEMASAWKMYRLSAGQGKGTDQAFVIRRFENLRQAINSATSPIDLQSRLKAAGGPQLSRENLSTPLPVLRPQLLASLDQAKNQAIEQFKAKKPDTIWTLLQRSFRVIITALGYSIAFGASVQRPDSELTIFQEWNRRRKLKKKLLSFQNKSASSGRRKLHR